jgi:hypothetical protein
MVSSVLVFYSVMSCSLAVGVCLCWFVYVLGWALRFWVLLVTGRGVCTAWTGSGPGTCVTDLSFDCSDFALVAPVVPVWRSSAACLSCLAVEFGPLWGSSAACCWLVRCVPAGWTYRAAGLVVVVVVALVPLGFCWRLRILRIVQVFVLTHLLDWISCGRCGCG